MEDDTNRDPFTMIPNWVFRNGHLDVHELAVYMVLLSYRNNDTLTAHPGQATIAKQTGLSKRTVIRTIEKLEVKGFVEVSRRRKRNGTNQLNVYKIARLGSEPLPVDNSAEAVELIDLPSDSQSLPSDSQSLPSDSQSLPSDSQSLPPSDSQSLKLEPSLTRTSKQDKGVVPAINLEALFDEAWTHWPKKVDRKDALAKFKTVAKKRDPHQLVKDITAHGQAHAAHTTRQFIPGLTVWLNKERWNNPLPQPDANTTISRGDRNLAFIQSLGNTETSRREISV